MERQSRRVSSSQWEILIEFLERNPCLARGYNNSARGREQSHRLWCQLTDLLNAEGSGAHKTSKGWATVSRKEKILDSSVCFLLTISIILQYFNNFKSKLKKIVADRNSEALKS